MHFIGSWAIPVTLVMEGSLSFGGKYYGKSYNRQRKTENA